MNSHITKEVLDTEATPDFRLETLSLPIDSQHTVSTPDIYDPSRFTEYCRKHTDCSEQPSTFDKPPITEQK